MDVVPGVTARAVSRRGRRLQRFTMAVAAEEPFVGAVEDKSGSCAVIEIPELPAVRVVTVVALRSEVAAMHVDGGMARRAIERGVLECLRNVAFFAWNECVRSDQRKAGEIVIEEYLVAPAALVVAPLAGLSFLAFVYVVRLVAGVARSLELAFVAPFAMTVVARGLCVLAAERVLGVPIVVEISRLPRRRHMATLALRPESAAMNVVPRVTPVAAPGRGIVEETSGMALLARHGGVPTFEPEARVFRMIEGDLRPSHRLVAVLALSSKAAGVLVVRFVTRLTVSRRRFVALGPVTALASDFTVSPLQWEIGPSVLEAGGLPGALVVAVPACITDARFVRIVIGMASRALVRRFAMLLRRIVASVAACSPVCPAQRKIAQIMRERFRIESDDVGVSTAVIRVTELARLVANGRCSAVKTPLRVEVELHPRVAREAQPSLAHFFEAFVAG
jgi:hypothetical protein